VLGYFDAAGAYQGDILIVPGNVTSGANLKWTMGTASFAAASGMTPTFTFTAVASMPATGMICWGAPGVTPPAPTWDRTVMSNWVDCVPYGSYAAAPIRNGPATTLGLGDGAFQSLVRTALTGAASGDYSYGCPTPQHTTNITGFNHDNHIDLPSSKPFDDLTWPNSDLVGDGCGDTDDDNDGISDADEATGAACGGIVTSSIAFDSDRDLLSDKWECDTGGANTDPNVPYVGSNPCPAGTDGDGDRLPDGKEACSYGTTAGLNTDGDALNDGCEAYTINGDSSVNVVDLQQIASEATGSYPFPATTLKSDFDVTKNKAIDVIDLQQTAAADPFCP
jgi:hypothetical protein